MLSRLPNRWRIGARRWAIAGSLALSLCGCTTVRDYLANGYKVGPNYRRPPAPVAERWIDEDDVRVRTVESDDSHWWTVFNDPVLNDLVGTAYRQNLTLREAGWRVLQRRAELGIARGNLMPQSQTMSGAFSRNNLSSQAANRFGTPELNFNAWDYGFNMGWELDFWGRFRRAIEASSAELDASVEHYDDVLVTLIADVASDYVAIRTLQLRLDFARQNVELQKTTLGLAEARFKGGQDNELTVNQAKSDLKLTEALVPQLEIQLREANNRLCILLGIPPEDLTAKLGNLPIPTAPVDVAVGIPADLLRRRPDVRRAERLAASASARIGVADAEFYPQISINGTFGWTAQQLPDLFDGNAFRGGVGPSFSWKILNYGRLVNNVRRFDALYEQTVLNYQNTVLKAGEQVEDGLVRYLKSQQRVHFLQQSVDAEVAAVKDAIAQYKGGLTSFTWVTIIQERLVQRQEELAQAMGDVPSGLIQVYRALGGGWQIRCTQDSLETGHIPIAALPVEQPQPEPLPKVPEEKPPQEMPQP